MSEPRVVELCRTWDRISDTEFERHYRTVPSACLSADIVHLDLRSSPWYDPWALIQFLLILGSKPVCTKPRRIILLSPEALGLGCDETKKENVIARLRFLSDMEFLDRAVELGVTLGLQTCRTEKPKAVSPSDVRQIAPPLAGEDDYGGRPIIPIISISSIVSQLRDKRDELFHKADVIFARYFTEAIVQEAGLGDCLLSELLANALEHGNSESAQRVGYIALRAGLGL